MKKAIIFILVLIIICILGIYFAPKTCEVCNGTKEIECEECYGKGLKSCMWCHYSGKCHWCEKGIKTTYVRCKFCEKYNFWGCRDCTAGMVAVRETCNMCDGTDICYDCKGTGFKEDLATCTYCEGNGKIACTNCDTD